MIAGKFPFSALSEYLMWQKIKNLEYSFPEDFDPSAKDLIQKILVSFFLFLESVVCVLGAILDL